MKVFRENMQTGMREEQENGGKGELEEDVYIKKREKEAMGKKRQQEVRENKRQTKVGGKKRRKGNKRQRDGGMRKIGEEDVEKGRFGK